MLKFQRRFVTKVSMRNIPDVDSPTFWEDLTMDWNLLARDVQLHKCTKTCLKYNRRECRFGFTVPPPYEEGQGNDGPVQNGKELHSKTSVEVDQFNQLFIRQRRQHALLNMTSMWLTVAMRCNTDVQLVLTSASARKATWYISDYVCKTNLTNSQTAVLLSAALEGLSTEVIPEHPQLGPDENKARRLILRALFLHNRESQVPAQMAALINSRGGFAWKSHTCNFVPLGWMCAAGRQKLQEQLIKNQIATLDPRHNTDSSCSGSSPTGEEHLLEPCSSDGSQTRRRVPGHGGVKVEGGVKAEGGVKVEGGVKAEGGVKVEVEGGAKVEGDPDNVKQDRDDQPSGQRGSKLNVKFAPDGKPYVLHSTWYYTQRKPFERLPSDSDEDQNETQEAHDTHGRTDANGDCRTSTIEALSYWQFRHVMKKTSYPANAQGNTEQEEKARTRTEERAARNGGMGLLRGKHHGHPEADRFFFRAVAFNKVFIPMILGDSIPLKRKDPERHAMMLLLLFRAWRESLDVLRRVTPAPDGSLMHDSWADAWKEWKQSIAGTDRWDEMAPILRNLKDVRTGEMQTQEERERRRKKRAEETQDMRDARNSRAGLSRADDASMQAGAWRTELPRTRTTTKRQAGGWAFTHRHCTVQEDAGRWKDWIPSAKLWTRGQTELGQTHQQTTQGGYVSSQTSREKQPSTT
jgi:hypothetical protein